MKRRSRLAALTLSTALGACTVVQPQEAEVERPEACAMVNPYAANTAATPRFHRYYTSVNMGDPLPSTVSSRGGGATRTWVGRSHRTRRVETGFSALSLLIVVQIIALIVGGFLLLILVLTLLGRNQPVAVQPGDSERDARTRKRFALATAATLLVGTLAGYFAGSVVSFDNPTTLPVEVVVDGQTVSIPAQSFVDLRLWGSNIDVEVRANGQRLEGATLHLDEDVPQAIRRAMFTTGRFVYSVCGMNTYSLQTANYGRR